MPYPRAALLRGRSAAVLLVAGAASCLAQAESPLDRGRYLMQSIVACGNCHTPQGPNGPLPGMELAGGPPIEEPGMQAWPGNITPDPETGIGRWSDAQIVAAIREGRRPDGTIIGPPMPIARYRGISDSDVAAIVAYLRSVPAVKNKVAPSTYAFPLPPAWGPPVDRVPDPAPGDKLAWGAYLAGPLGHCIECHSAPGPRGAPDVEQHLGAGGMAFHGPWGVSVSSNITPRALAAYSDADLKKVITSGVRPDGSRLKRPMAVTYYARMKGSDLDAVVAYLRSLPPK